MGSMIEPLICPSLCVYPQVSRLVLTTFIDSAKLWDEEIFALGQLNGLGEERLIDIWKTFGWVIREREERPGKMYAAWAAVSNIRQ
jgi:hypothetical protein